MPETPQYTTLPHAENIPGTLVRRMNDGSVGGITIPVGATDMVLGTATAPWNAKLPPPAAIAISGTYATATGAVGISTNALRAMPCHLPAGMRISGLGMYVNVGAAISYRWSLYATLPTFFPGALIASTPDTNIAVPGFILGAVNITISTTGWYWVAVQSNGVGSQVWSGVIASNVLGWDGSVVPGNRIGGLADVAAFGVAAPDPFPATAGTWSASTYPIFMATTAGSVF